LLRGSDVQQLMVMKREGLSTQAISKLTGYDRKTVRKYLLKPETAPRYGPRVARPSKLDAHTPYLQDRMKAGVWNAQVLLRELRKLGYQGGYTSLKDWLQPQRAAGMTTAVLGDSHRPGQHEAGAVFGQGAAHAARQRNGDHAAWSGLPSVNKSIAEVKTRRNRGALRPVAGRGEILAAARSIGVRDGWKAVTVRAVAKMLSYTAPLLYEYFRDKQEILTELAVEGQLSLARELARELPQEHGAAVLVLVQRYWSFMLEQPQIYG
jgi:hypothetical protein